MKKTLPLIFALMILIIPVSTYSGYYYSHVEVCIVSDDFSSDLSKWTEVQGTWAITGAELGVSVGNNDYNRLNYTDCGTFSGATQWARMKIAGTEYMGAWLRSGASGNAYCVFVRIANDTVYWEVADDGGSSVETIVNDGASLDWNEDDIMGIKVTGTGNDTVVTVWMNPDGASGTDPDSWGAADITFSDNPTNNIDSGAYVGAMTYDDIGFIDDFTGGEM